MNSSWLAWELLKSSSDSMVAAVVVSGVAGSSMADSGVFFLRETCDTERLSPRSSALRLQAEGGVVI